MDLHELITRRRAQLAGAMLLVGGAGFWLAWLLMPMAGTRDAALILAEVARARSAVWASCAVQLVSAAAWAMGLVLMPGPAELARPRDGQALDRWGRLAWWAGAALLAVGMCGSAADAIFHLVAYELTAPSIAPGLAAPVMARFQGPDLVLLAPAMAAWAAGVVLFTVAGVRLRLVPRAALAGFGVAALAMVVAVLFPGVRRAAALVVLGGAVVPPSWVGWAVARARPPAP